MSVEKRGQRVMRGCMRCFKVVESFEERECVRKRGSCVGWVVVHISTSLNPFPRYQPPYFLKPSTDFISSYRNDISQSCLTDR